MTLITSPKQATPFFTSSIFRNCYHCITGSKHSHKRLRPRQNVRTAGVLADLASMAAESLLPLFHETSAAHMAADGRGPSEEDDLLAELLGGAGVSAVIC